MILSEPISILVVLFRSLSHLCLLPRRIKFGESVQHQNMKRESKAYSYEEQLQDIELKKVSYLFFLIS